MAAGFRYCTAGKGRAASARLASCGIGSGPTSVGVYPLPASCGIQKGDLFDPGWPALVMASTRRLAAILAADVAGYSRLMGTDEEGTLAALKALRRELADPKIKEHHGRIVKTTGDGLLIEFVSVVDAPASVQAAVFAADYNAQAFKDWTCAGCDAPLTAALANAGGPSAFAPPGTLSTNPASYAAASPGADSRAYCISHLARRSPSALRSDGKIGRHRLRRAGVPEE